MAGKPPDAVLLDVQLGSEDGAALAIWMRQQTNFRNTPVLAVTAHAMVSDKQRILQAGCNACISKPIDFRDLRNQLDTWFAISARRAQSPINGEA